MKVNLGILISGRGSNMVAIADAVLYGDIEGCVIAVVVSDKPDAPGIAKAVERGIETVVVERNGRTREEHDAEIIKVLKDRSVDLVCLAGYMRLLSPLFVNAFPDRILNIHPSLLPEFPGLNVQQRAIDAGVRESGCTVHYVNEDLDAGRVIVQRRVPVLPGDTAETLSARILEQEHAAYIDAIKIVARRSTS